MNDGKDFKLLIKAKELATHTFIITSNCNHYPKKYRFTLVDKMQNKALMIVNSIIEANQMESKRELQRNVIMCCDELLFYIELSVQLGITSAIKIEYWSGLVSDIKFMTLAWMKSK
jgi:hypothetical protein